MSGLQEVEAGLGLWADNQTAYQIACIPAAKVRVQVDFLRPLVTP